DELRPKVVEDCRFPPVTPHAVVSFFSGKLASSCRSQFPIANLSPSPRDSIYEQQQRPAVMSSSFRPFIRPFVIPPRQPEVAPSSIRTASRSRSGAPVHTEIFRQAAIGPFQRAAADSFPTGSGASSRAVSASRPGVSSTNGRVAEGHRTEANLATYSSGDFVRFYTA
ncbi:ATP-dependent RNA helicase SUV3, partial [Striga asiatica]